MSEKMKSGPTRQRYQLGTGKIKGQATDLTKKGPLQHGGKERKSETKEK